MNKREDIRLSLPSKGQLGQAALDRGLHSWRQPLRRTVRLQLVDQPACTHHLDDKKRVALGFFVNLVNKAFLHIFS